MYLRASVAGTGVSGPDSPGESRAIDSHNRPLSLTKGTAGDQGAPGEIAGVSPALDNSVRCAVAADRKRARHEARDLLRLVESTPASQVRCGLHVVRDGGAQLRISTGPSGTVAGWAGIGTCGKVWSCPVCASKILNRRQLDIEAALRIWLRPDVDQGLWRSERAVGFLTVTMRHNRGHSLAALWDALSAAWRHMGMSGDYDAARALLWSGGTIRTYEVTHGAQGWHVHIHTIMLLSRIPSSKDQRKARRLVFAQWRESLALQGCEASDLGQDFRVMHDLKGVLNSLGQYVSKAQYGTETARSASFEVTRADMKSGRGGNRTPFQILRELLGQLDGNLTDPDAVERDLAIWAEWVKGSKGRRAQAWSRGLRDRLGLEAELTDMEAASVEEGTIDGAVADVRPDAYARLQRRFVGSGLAFLLDVASMYDSHGLQGVRILCRREFGDDVTFDAYLDPGGVVRAA